MWISLRRHRLDKQHFAIELHLRIKPAHKNERMDIHWISPEDILEFLAKL